MGEGIPLADDLMRISGLLEGVNNTRPMSYDK